ncbi:odorant receptor 4 isoform X2 [Solenopsis invicta]|uniref:odorant receptor 4 isoform X2 n=1 Tax=Solenopsis invicta TaxID=13686 RepID=UPI00193DB334|nr:odorant receptor 4 isoform X2 [Solenopsis invicta]
MICIKSRYFHLNRIFLLALGLWPYSHQSNFVRFQIILCFSFLASSIIVQLTVFFTTECTLYLIIKVSSTAMYCSTFVINYNSFWINAHNVKTLMERLQEICNELKDENEINIMKDYGNSVKFYTFVLTMLTAISTCTIVSVSLFMPIVLHMNESQTRQLIYFTSEYFIDQEKYAYLILIHSNIVLCIGITTVSTIGTMLRGCCIHACGLFKVASYRIEHALAMKMFKNINIENEIIYKEIICAVDIHRKAIKYSEFLLSSFKGTLFSVMVIHVICLSLNLFAVFQTAALGKKEEFSYHCLIVIVILLYMFLANYTGQEIIDHNNDIYIAAYNARWYVAPVHIQKLILFLLQRGGKPFNLSVASIFVASLECFATVIIIHYLKLTLLLIIQEKIYLLQLLKASMSYFTFICSAQQ